MKKYLLASFVALPLLVSVSYAAEQEETPDAQHLPSMSQNTSPELTLAADDTVDASSNAGSNTAAANPNPSQEQAMRDLMHKLATGDHSGLIELDFDFATGRLAPHGGVDLKSSNAAAASIPPSILALNRIRAETEAALDSSNSAVRRQTLLEKTDFGEVLKMLISDKEAYKRMPVDLRRSLFSQFLTINPKPPAEAWAAFGFDAEMRPLEGDLGDSKSNTAGSSASSSSNSSLSAGSTVSTSEDSESVALHKSYDPTTGKLILTRKDPNTLG